MAQRDGWLPYFLCILGTDTPNEAEARRLGAPGPAKSPPGQAPKESPSPTVLSVSAPAAAPPTKTPPGQAQNGSPSTAVPAISGSSVPAPAPITIPPSLIADPPTGTLHPTILAPPLETLAPTAFPPPPEGLQEAAAAAVAASESVTCNVYRSFSTDADVEELAEKLGVTLDEFLELNPQADLDKIVLEGTTGMQFCLIGSVQVSEGQTKRIGKVPSTMATTLPEYVPTNGDVVKAIASIRGSFNSCKEFPKSDKGEKRECFDGDEDGQYGIATCNPKSNMFDISACCARTSGLTNCLGEEAVQDCGLAEHFTVLDYFGCGELQLFMADLEVEETGHRKLTDISTWGGAVFEHDYYRGNRQDLYCQINMNSKMCQGDYYNWWNLQNDAITSIYLEPGYTLQAYEHTNYLGASVTYTSLHNYWNWAWVGSYWNDRISSMFIKYNDYLEISALEKEAGKIEFIDVFNTDKALGFFVSKKPRVCGRASSTTGWDPIYSLADFQQQLVFNNNNPIPGSDNVRICRGFTHSLQYKPSCWVTFDGSNDALDWLENVDVIPKANGWLASGSNTIPISSGLNYEFEKLRDAMTKLFRSVCFDNGNISSDGLDEVWFQGHSKGGANAIVAAYYFTAPGKGYIPASRTNIMVTGSLRAFPPFAVDPDYRFFKSAKTYQTIEVLNQETSSYWSGRFWETHNVNYDLVWDLPTPLSTHFPWPQAHSSNTKYLQLIRRRARLCTSTDWAQACNGWSAWNDDGYWVAANWRDLGISMGRCTGILTECPPVPQWGRHDFDQNYKYYIWRTPGYN